VFKRDHKGVRVTHVRLNRYRDYLREPILVQRSDGNGDGDNDPYMQDRGEVAAVLVWQRHLRRMGCGGHVAATRPRGGGGGGGGRGGGGGQQQQQQQQQHTQPVHTHVIMLRWDLLVNPTAETLPPCLLRAPAPLNNR